MLLNKPVHFREWISKAYLRVSLDSSLITSASFGNSSFMSCLGLDEVQVCFVLPAADDIGPPSTFSFIFLSGLSSFSVHHRLKGGQWWKWKLGDSVIEILILTICWFPKKIVHNTSFGRQLGFRFFSLKRKCFITRGFYIWIPYSALHKH